ncbi:MAG: PIN domain-containing protein [Gemmatimonadales bacterium]
MTVHLDTGFLIRALVPGSDEDRALRGWLRRGASLGMSTIAWAEFLCGPVGAEHAELAARVVGNRVPFVEDDAALAARLFNLAGRRRGTLTDCMIAATAVAAGAALATTNTADFRRFEVAGLELATA